MFSFLPVSNWRRGHSDAFMFAFLQALIGESGEGAAGATKQLLHEVLGPFAVAMGKVPAASDGQGLSFCLWSLSGKTVVTKN